MSTYVRELRSIDQEMRRLRKQLKTLQTLKQAPTTALYNFLNSQMFLQHSRVEGGKTLYLIREEWTDNYEGIPIKKLLPRLPRKIKSATAKKRDALTFFRQEGVPDPDAFFERFYSTQTVAPVQN